MEKSEEGVDRVVEGLLGAVRPPRLENAGLEDCALPLESIMEAFSLAAKSLKAPVVSSLSGSVDDALDGEVGGCVQDPGPSNGQIPDKLLGASEISPRGRPLCGGAGKEVECEGGEDEVVVFGGGDMTADKIVLVGGAIGEANWRESVFGGQRGCIVDGEVLPGEKNGSVPHGSGLDDDDKNKEGPILVDGII